MPAAAGRCAVPPALLLPLVAAAAAGAAGALALDPTPAPPFPGLEASTVFSAGDCDTHGECYPFFRIPALKRAKSGALLAFAEARGGQSGSGSDHGDVHIVVRRSADGTGRNGSWGPIYVVANETGHTIGNPSPVVDAGGGGRVWCHFARDNTDAFVAYSDDEGRTWSPRRALDAAVKVPGSGWYGSGVGGGVQLPTGRLIILSEERYGAAFNSVPVYSDDGGATWLRGGYLNTRDNVSLGLGEPSVALLGNSSDLIMSARAASHAVSVAVSRDAGLSWGMASPVAAIHSPGCQSPVAGACGGASALVTSPVGARRAQLTLFRAAADTGFADWQGGLLWAGQAGYSSLLVEADGGQAADVLCLFESGATSGPMYKTLTLLRMQVFCGCGTQQHPVPISPHSCR